MAASTSASRTRSRTSQPRDRSPAGPSFRFVIATRRPCSLRAIHVPPADRSSGPYTSGSRSIRSGLRAGRSYRSSRFAPTATGAPERCRVASAMVHIVIRSVGLIFDSRTNCLPIHRSARRSRQFIRPLDCSWPLCRREPVFEDSSQGIRFHLATLD